MTSRLEKNIDKQTEIEEEEKRDKRKKCFIFFFKITITLIVLFFGFYFYTSYISSTKILVKEKRIINKKIPDKFNGIKIIQFSDLYFGNSVTNKELDNMINAINERKPDIVLFTGNIFDSKYKVNLKRQENIINKFQKINDSISKYAVMGRNDNKELFTTIMNQSNFNILDNNYDLIYNDDNNPILLVGLSNLDNRNIDNAYKYFEEANHNANIYTISMMGETTDLDDILAKYNNDLVLAGNSLNGEVRLPLIGGLIKQDGSSKYKNSYYKV